MLARLSSAQRKLDDPARGTVPENLARLGTMHQALSYSAIRRRDRSPPAVVAMAASVMGAIGIAGLDHHLPRAPLRMVKAAGEAPM
jgi:hypothetical protein